MRDNYSVMKTKLLCDSVFDLICMSPKREQTIIRDYMNCLAGWAKITLFSSSSGPNYSKRTKIIQTILQL